MKTIFFCFHQGLSGDAGWAAMGAASSVAINAEATTFVVQIQEGH